MAVEAAFRSLLRAPAAAPALPQPPLRSDVVAIVISTIPVIVSGIGLLLGATAPNALVLLALVSALCAVLALWRAHAEAGRSTEIGMLVFQVAMLFWFYGPALGTALTESQWAQSAAQIRITNRDALRAFMGVNVFNFLFTVTYQVWRPRALARRMRWALGAGTQIPLGPFVALLAIWLVVSIGFYFVLSAGIQKAVGYVLQSRTEVKPWSAEGNYGTAISPLNVVANSSMVVIAVFCCHVLLTQKLSPAYRVALASLFLAAAGWVSIDSGTRSFFVMMSATALLLYYRGLFDRAEAHRYVRYAIIGAVVLLVFVASELQRNYRYTLELTPSSRVLGDSDFFTQTAYAWAVQEKEGRLTRDSVTFLLVSGPIPRVLWPQQKPELESIVVFSKYVWGVDIRETGGNTLPSVVGQYYISWGWLGVVEVALALGLLFRLGDAAYAMGRGWFVGIVWALVIMYVFVSFRGISFSFLPPVYLMIGATWIIRAATVRLKTVPMGPPLPSRMRI